MLTHTDIHYLVGLLTKVQEAADVIIELGDFVYDDSSKTKRDVDITVTVTESNGQKSAYKGVEVKDHKRPLTTPIVEGLCQKLNDMSAITNRAIVSASGYTKPAVTKARSHNVDLFEIVDWSNPREGFNVKLEKPGLTLIEHEWLDGPHVKVNVAQEDYSKLEQNLGHKLKVVDASGGAYDRIKNLGDLTAKAHKLASDKARSKINPLTAKPGDSVTVRQAVKFSKTPYLLVSNQSIAVNDCFVTGSIGVIVHDESPVFKVLRKHGSKKPLTGCAMQELRNGNLVGISVSNLNNKITALNIPYSDRVKNVIRKRRIGGGKQ